MLSRWPKRTGSIRKVVGLPKLLFVGSQLRQTSSMRDSSVECDVLSSEGYVAALSMMMGLYQRMFPATYQVAFLRQGSNSYLSNSGIKWECMGYCLTLFYKHPTWLCTRFSFLRSLQCVDIIA